MKLRTIRYVIVLLLASFSVFGFSRASAKEDMCSILANPELCNKWMVAEPMQVSGTLQSKILSNAPTSATVTDLAGNPLIDLPFSTGEVYTIQKSFLVVSSVTKSNPSPSNAASIDFTVTLSEAVTGVDTGDFVLTTSGVSGAGITSVTPVSGTTYTVAVGTGSGNGTIRLDVLDDNSIVDGNGNPLGGAAAGDGNYTGGEVYAMTRSVVFTDQLFHTSNPPVRITIPNAHGTAIQMGELVGSESVSKTAPNTAKSFFIENDNCSGATVAGGGSCTFDVRFLPWLLGAKSGTVTIPSDAVDGPYVVPLSGNAVPGTQLLSNRSFDTYSGVTKLPDLWTFTGLKPGVDVVDTSWAFHGPVSMKLVGDGTLKIIGQVINKSGVPGDDFSFNVMTSGAGIPANGQRWLLQVMFLNNGVTVENRNIPLTTGTFSNVRLTRMYTANSVYNQILFRVHYAKSSGTAWIDLANLQWAP